MKKKAAISFFLLLFALCSNTYIACAQHENFVNASLNGETKEITINQEFTYFNDSKVRLSVLYFNDWAHSYSDKNTGLAKRFADEFNRSLHLAKDRERGKTKILSAVDAEYRGLHFERTKERDIIKIDLNEPLEPGDSATLFITYTVKLPPKKYTPYGYSNKNSYYLKDWYLTPAFFDGTWHLYSNKGLEDLYTGITNTTVSFTYPEKLFIASNFGVLSNSAFPKNQNAQLQGSNRKSCEIILEPIDRFETHVTGQMTVVTDLESKRFDDVYKSISILKVSEFISENLGVYPHGQLLVSEIDYLKYPLYGLNQLPRFIRPYEEKFQFEMKFLKTALQNILKESMFLNPRKDQWLNDAITNYLMIAYVEQHYPDQKLLGKLSKIWGVRSFNLAKMDFNEQYPFLYMFTARKNQGQPLETPQDSLLKFNQRIANKYKAGLGLAYLANYIGKDKVDNSIKTFYRFYKENRTKPLDFESILKRATDTDINWFFHEYVSTDKQIDFKIKEIEKTEDSLYVTLKNKKGTNVPISLFGLRNDSVVSKYWFHNIKDQKTFAIPRNGEEKMVLNYDQKIPEFNQRDNWKSLKGFLSGNKKLKFTFFKDSENPYLNQVFYVPIVNFNTYDGWAPGLRLYNKTFLERPFVYDVAPSYSFREGAFVGYGKLSYRQYLNKSGLYVANYAFRGSTSHFDTNSRFTSFTPSMSLGWRPSDLRSNKRQFLSLRYINIFRDLDNLAATANAPETPDYSVFNARYINVDNNIIDYKSWVLDFQQADRFTKLSLEAEYRKLFENNTQFNIRFYAGKFLWNNIDPSIDFFDFALDRPKDYLFDYNYLGRSEETGIYSQQIIIAEGGFKSILDEEYRFSNDWITTMNTSVNLWKWVEFYGDLGYVKNRGTAGKFVYDSGIRANLVTDFFELYFPLYSNNGWEVGQPNYGEKIRFIVTVSPKTLIGLFTRKWF